MEESHEMKYLIKKLGYCLTRIIWFEQKDLYLPFLEHLNAGGFMQATNGVGQ